MATELLATKLYVPQPRANAVQRSRLHGLLDAVLSRKLALVSAGAGYGKTTLVGTWLATTEAATAWLSLDDDDNEPQRFLVHLIAALQTAAETVGQAALAALESPQAVRTHAVLTSLLNDLAAAPADIVLVLDDYHLIRSSAVHDAMAFLLEHVSPGLHVVIATREAPPLPLSRLRVRDELVEVGAADMRFTPAEAAELFARLTEGTLADDDVATLDARTEGWIAGLQLAALSMRDHADPAAFIRSFTGSNTYIWDYLAEEVLRQQPQAVQEFLVQTSVLERLCGPLCDAVVSEEAPRGQDILEYLERANLFVVALDNERRWYRYHHLFREFLRRRLDAGEGNTEEPARSLHGRAAAWFEAKGMPAEAFHHAAAADNLAAAVQAMERQGANVLSRGGAGKVLDWLDSLPQSALDRFPLLWVGFASALSLAGRNSRVDWALAKAEAALAQAQADEATRNALGRVAAIRARMAASRYDTEEMIRQSNRALSYLSPDNLAVRASANWSLGLACQLRGDGATAIQAYTAAVTESRADGNAFMEILATTGAGSVRERAGKLAAAAKSYRRVVHLAGSPPLPAACEAHLGLARIAYQRNEPAVARRHVDIAAHLANQIEEIDTPVGCDVLRARLALADGQAEEALRIIRDAQRTAEREGFAFQQRELAAVEVRVMLRLGDVGRAEAIAAAHEIALAEARVLLARGEAGAARELVERAAGDGGTAASGAARLEATALRALALRAAGESEAAQQTLADALSAARPEGFVRIFLDEGPPMARLAYETGRHGIVPELAHRLVDAFAEEAHRTAAFAGGHTGAGLVEPLSRRELDVLALVADGLSNDEIAARLYVSLSTVKGHNRSTFAKLGVQRRTEAVARARELSLL